MMEAEVELVSHTPFLKKTKQTNPEEFTSSVKPNVANIFIKPEPEDFVLGPHVQSMSDKTLLVSDNQGCGSDGTSQDFS